MYYLLLLLTHFSYIQVREKKISRRESGIKSALPTNSKNEKFRMYNLQMYIGIIY